MLKRSHYAVFVLILLAGLALVGQSERARTRLKRAVGGLFLPLFGIASSAQSFADRSAAALTPRPELQRQIEQLQEELQHHRLAAMQWEEVARENGRLREAQGLYRQYPWKFKMAKVVGRDPANWWRTILINLGTRDGLTNHLPVVCSEGLVGRLSEVGYSHSTVVLLGDPDCRVPVIVKETRDCGVIAPAETGPIDNTIVDLKYLSSNSALKTGHQVLTSGLANLFPQGILVGQIADVRTVQFGLHLEARVRLAARLNTLEEVFVLLP